MDPHIVAANNQSGESWCCGGSEDTALAGERFDGCVVADCGQVPQHDLLAVTILARGACIGLWVDVSGWESFGSTLSDAAAPSRASRNNDRPRVVSVTGCGPEP